MGDMKISLVSLASEIPGLVSVDDVEVVLTDVTHDSRLAGPAVAFVAIEGTSADGHQFVEDAAAAGSPAVMVNRRLSVSVPQIVVEDSRLSMAYLAKAVHGSPDADLTIVGITGTNGKTTVSSMCEAVLVSVNHPSGLIGTLGARIGGIPYALKRTTPESTDLQRLLGVICDRGIDTVFMEVSSHALELHRAAAIEFKVAAFTNLSQDHLDFHGDMESYYAAKRKLFDSSRAKHAIINVGDPSGARLASEVSATLATGAVTTVGVGTDADVRADITHQTGVGTEFTILADGHETSVRMPVVGSFNVANAAVAFAICLRLGVASEAIASGLGSLSPIAGRMQVVGRESDITVVVDYAHTPAAVETVLEAGRHMTEGHVVAVVGAAGDRDKDKRFAMGVAAAKNADTTIVTTDNPRTEDPLAIASEVKSGADSARSSGVQLIVDRAEAIDVAISLASPGDVVLILGKGHEQGQEVMGTLIPFDDASVAAESVARRIERKRKDAAASEAKQ